MPELPQPTKNALAVHKLTWALVADLGLPSVFKELIEIHQQKVMERGIEVLLEEVSRRGLGALAAEKFEYYVPMAYRFLEQVRLREYEHNLRIIAALLAQQISLCPDEIDVGAVGRAARKLEMMPMCFLVGFARCRRAFEIRLSSGKHGEGPASIDEIELQSAYEECGEALSLLDGREILFELATRGILTMAPRPQTLGGQAYYQNAAYREIIEATAAVAK